MSLTDIMSHSELSVYPQIALIIFLAVFASVSARVLFSRRRRDDDDRAAFLPMDDAPIAAPPKESQSS